ncbi:MAG: hypothetical protein F4219_05800 [Gammaproteobacteria bacterium]|nr:hypothetical protein [Gammaproteobacteria bacterium]
MNLTPSQEEALQATEAAVVAKQRLLLWWMGGVRAGKSYGSALCFLRHQHDREQALYLILAYTQSQAQRVFGPVFQNLGEALGYTVRVTGGSSPKIEVWTDGRSYKRGMEGGNVFLLKGADTIGRDRAIQGLTCDGLLCDELALLDRNTVHQAEARVSKPGGLRIYTTNKTHEYHWSVKYYVNRIKSGAIQGKILDCSVQENPHIDADYVAERCSEFTGNTLTRFMENEFSLDAPPIYDVKVLDDPLQTDGRLAVSIYGHPNGYEVVVARLTTDGLYLDNAYSLPVQTDVVQFVKENVGAAPNVVLLNRTQTILARWLRRQRWPIKGFGGPGDARVQEPLLKACGRGLVTMNPDAYGLIEAVKTHHQPGRLDYPVIAAVEALGYTVRSRLMETVHAS